METPKLDSLIQRFQKARAELEAELEIILTEKRDQFQYTIERGKIIFDRSILKFQRSQRTNSFQYIANASVKSIISAPIIYSMIVPLVFLDVCTTAYQHVCFRLYAIPRVPRQKYIVIDRHQLAYLNTIQKFNCIYCGYGNGLIGYVREILARTEQFWCPIKHAQRGLATHGRESKYLDFGDAEGWKNNLKNIQCDWDESEDPSHKPANAKPPIR